MRAQYWGRTVESIQVKGLKRIEADAVLAKISTQKSKKLSSERVRSDIEALYALGYFDDISVDGTPVGADRVRITFVLKERPVIARLSFEGNEHVDDDDIKKEIKTKEWSILDERQVRADIEKIEKLYEEKGYFLAKVDYVVETLSKDEVSLTFKVNDFDKVQIRRILFLNNKAFSDEQLKGVLMQTSEKGALSFITDSGSFKEEAFKMDMQRLAYWYLDKGYVKFRYENPTITISDDKRYLYISIFVEEGEPYQIGSTSFSGDILFKPEELRESLKQTPGKTFRITERNVDIQTLTEKYQDLGYAFVNVIPQTRFNDESKTIDMDYQFEKGSLVQIGEIRISGNTKTHDKVIRRELRIHEGELFSGSNLRRSRERVERLGYFEPGQVVFNTLTRKGRDDIVDIEIIIRERNTGSINLGAGWGSVGGFFLQGQIQEINLFGRGWNINASAQFSIPSGKSKKAKNNINQTFSLTFTEPYFLDSRWSLGGSLFYSLAPIPNRYSARRGGAHLTTGYQFDKNMFLIGTYKLENVEIVNPIVIDPNKSDAGILSGVMFKFEHDLRNNRFETTSGTYQSAQLEFAGLGGKKKFAKWILDNRVYWNVVGDLVLRNQTVLGHIMSLGNSIVPPSERFYLGGPFNMRGYRYAEFGPQESLPSVADPSKSVNVPVGGLIEAFSLLEFEYPIIREAGLKFVTFLEIGNVWDGWPTGNFRMKYDAGVGIRWFSPMGPLRFEFGWPFGDPAHPGPEFQFFIGQPF